MRFITIFLNFFLLTFLLTGCLSSSNWVWYKEGGSQDELAKDNYHCLLNSQQKQYNAHSSIPLGSNLTYTYATSYAQKEIVTNYVIFDACMNAHGWYKREILSPAM